MPKTIFIAAIIAAVLLALFFLYPFLPFDVWGAASSTLPQGAVSRSQVFSNILGPLSAIAALVALLINFDAANRTTLQTARTEQAARYQKAVELIGSEKSTSKIAGVVLLGGLATENPARYREPVAGTLAAALSELDTSFKDRCGLFKLDDAAAYRGKFPSATYASYDMLSWFGDLRHPKVDAWPRELWRHLDNGRFPLLKLYLEDSYYTRLNLSRTDFERAVMKDLTFNECNLADASWSFSVCGPVAFRACDLRGAGFKIWDSANRRLWSPTSLITVEGGKVQGFKINGLTVDEWRGGATLPDQQVAGWNHAGEVKPRWRSTIAKRYFDA